VEGRVPGVPSGSPGDRQLGAPGCTAGAPLRAPAMEAGLGYPGVHPADAGVGPRYAGGRATRVDPIWAAIRAEAKLEVRGFAL